MRYLYNKNMHLKICKSLPNTIPPAKTIRQDGKWVEVATKWRTAQPPLWFVGEGFGEISLVVRDDAVAKDQCCLKKKYTYYTDHDSDMIVKSSQLDVGFFFKLLFLWDQNYNTIYEQFIAISYNRA